jgi:hypothetical protein
MDEEVVPLGHDVQVVDPDVRGYVYGLVTAVSSVLLPCLANLLTWSTISSEVSTAKMPTDTCSEMTPWPVYAT